MKLAFDCPVLMWATHRAWQKDLELTPAMSKNLVPDRCLPVVVSKSIIVLSLRDLMRQPGVLT
jgi:hypothetical protein